MDFIVDCFMGVVIGWLCSNLKLIVCCFIGVWVGWQCGNLIRKYMRIREIQRRMEESQHNIILLSQDFKDVMAARMIKSHRQFLRQDEVLVLPHCTK